jgi:hypothetical protein
VYVGGSHDSCWASPAAASGHVGCTQHLASNLAVKAALTHTGPSPCCCRRLPARPLAQPGALPAPPPPLHLPSQPSSRRRLPVLPGHQRGPGSGAAAEGGATRGTEAPEAPGGARVAAAVLPRRLAALAVGGAGDGGGPDQRRASGAAGGAGGGGGAGGDGHGVPAGGGGSRWGPCRGEGGGWR